MASTVTSKYGDLTETIPLFEGRLHIPTIKDTFTLRVARIDGVLAPVDSQGFTYAMFKPGDTLNISGTSADVAAMPDPDLTARIPYLEEQRQLDDGLARKLYDNVFRYSESR
ncbi:TPA: hypothetical protein ACH3X1_009765 [Trebouxia sp. C0004]